MFHRWGLHLRSDAWPLGFAWLSESAREQRELANSNVRWVFDALEELSALHSSATSPLVWRIDGDLRLIHCPTAERVMLTWPSGPLNDMLADAVAATLLRLQAGIKMGPSTGKAARS